MIGDACDDLLGPFVCVPELDAEAGTPLRCLNGMLVATDLFDNACAGLCPMGSANPVNACAGFGQPANCLCQPNIAEDCGGAQLGCFNGNQIKLCLNDQVVIGQCNNCAMMDGYFSCSE
jgi:hypothetical protein